MVRNANRPAPLSQVPVQEKIVPSSPVLTANTKLNKEEIINNNMTLDSSQIPDPRPAMCPAPWSKPSGPKDPNWFNSFNVKKNRKKPKPVMTKIPNQVFVQSIKAPGPDAKINWHPSTLADPISAKFARSLEIRAGFKVFVPRIRKVGSRKITTL